MMGIVISLIGIALAGWGIKLQFFSKPKKEMEHLILLFRATQQLSLQVQKNLEKWIGQHNGQERVILPGITYGSYLEEMKTSYQKNLSDELLHKIETLDLTKNTIETMTKSLETQFDALAQIQVQLNLWDRESAKPQRLQN